MQQCQGRLSKMFLSHNGTNKIDSPALNFGGTIFPLIRATCFPFKGGSQHGLPSLPCNCACYQNTRVVLLTGELFVAMVCSRLSLSNSRLILNVKLIFKTSYKYIFDQSTPACINFPCFLVGVYVFIHFFGWSRFQSNWPSFSVL